jgi:hypothetical protein
LLDTDGLHLIGRMSSKSFSSIIPEHDFVLFIAAHVLPFIRMECAFETGLAGAAACSGVGFGGGAAAIACRGAMAGAGTCCGGAASAGSNGRLIVPDKLLAAANVNVLVLVVVVLELLLATHCLYLRRTVCTLYYY